MRNLVRRRKANATVQRSLGKQLSGGLPGSWWESEYRLTRAPSRGWKYACLISHRSWSVFFDVLCTRQHPDATRHSNTGSTPWCCAVRRLFGQQAGV